MLQHTVYNIIQYVKMQYDITLHYMLDYNIAVYDIELGLDN